MRARGAEGSGGVLVLALIGAILASVLGIVPVVGTLVGRQRAAAAADAAALAAADVASGAASGVVCEVAERAAGLNDAALAGCEVDGAVVTVAATVVWMGVAITTRSRAGPAP